MLISRRTALAYGSSTLAASGITPSFAAVGASDIAPAQLQKTQLVQLELIHDGETAGHGHYAALAMPSSDTVWTAHGLLREDGVRAKLEKYRLRGYRLRRLNAFHTAQGMRYAAIWQFGSVAASQLRMDMSENQFRAEASSQARLGHSLAHVSAVGTPSGPRFVAMWEKAEAPRQEILFAQNEEMLDAQRRAKAQDGYRLRQLAGYAEDGAPRFVAVYEAGADRPQEIRHAIRAADYAGLSRTMTGNGLLLRDASGYRVGGEPYYTAIWEAA